MEKIIECLNLTHYYGDRLIYKDLNFEVEKGKVLGLLGKNGTGKTTTINILNGYLKPYSGQCKLFGEDITTISPETRQRIGLLIEGHQQYAFMNVYQLEKFYSSFYPKWNRDVYFELIKKLQISPKQALRTMSCGQRSQVVLGLILAQNADLLILDDFSMGLDPGYRRLFIDYIRDFCSSEDKTVFVTSHIIQDLERFVDDVIILDYGKILVQDSIKNLMQRYSKYQFQTEDSLSLCLEQKDIISIDRINDEVDLYTNAHYRGLADFFKQCVITTSEVKEVPISLEDIFILLTGKY